MREQHNVPPKTQRDTQRPPISPVVDGQELGYTVSVTVHRPAGSFTVKDFMERGSSVVECRTRNRVSPGSNPSLLPFRILGIFVLSVVVPVDSAVYMSTWL